MRTKAAVLKSATLLLMSCSAMANSALSEPSMALLPNSEHLSAATNTPVVDGLAAALRATMTHNPMLKGKQAEVEVQQYGVSSAKARRYPTLSAQGSNFNDGYDQATLRVEQPIWAFGKIDSAIELAESGVYVEQWHLLDIQRQLLEETAVSYAKIAGIKQRMRVAQSNIGAHQDYYQRIARRQKGQLSSEADMRLAYSRLLQAQTQLQSIQGELSVAQTELQALTQVPVATEVAVDPLLAQLPSYADVQRLAVEQAANIRLKRQNLQVARLELKTEKLSVLPTIYFSVETDLLDNVSGNDDLRAGLTFQSSLEGLGLVARGRVKGAESRLAAAQYDLDSSVIDIRRRVDALMLNRQVQEGLINAQQQVEEAMQQTLASFLRQYETGRKSWLELLNTQRELNTLQLQLAQSRNDWLILSLRVASLTGVLDQLAGLNTDEQ